MGKELWLTKLAHELDVLAWHYGDLDVVIDGAQLPSRLKIQSVSFDAIARKVVLVAI